MKKTTRLELVETHTLALALNRLGAARPYDGRRWRRALYHALGISSVASNTEHEKLRLALELP